MISRPFPLEIKTEILLSIVGGGEVPCLKYSKDDLTDALNRYGISVHFDKKITSQKLKYPVYVRGVADPNVIMEKVLETYKGSIHDLNRPLTVQQSVGSTSWSYTVSKTNPSPIWGTKVEVEVVERMVAPTVKISGARQSASFQLEVRPGDVISPRDIQRISAKVRTFDEFRDILTDFDNRLR